MLVATRDDGPHAHAVHYGPHTPARSLASRFTTGIQLVGSLVGIPLALIGGYSTYHASFSPEGKCQALRANIVSMLDRKTDATTLRLLVQKDVVTFERECGEVDADAAAAFRALVAVEKPAVTHRVTSPAKVEKVEKAEKIGTVVAPQQAKVEKHEPAKREALKREAPAKEAVAKAEPPKLLGAPPHSLVAPPSAAETIAAPAQLEKPSGGVKEGPKSVETAAVPPEKSSVDAAWVASVRDALRESASQPAAAETTSDLAPIPGPIDISPGAQVATGAPTQPPGPFTPPANVGPGGSRPQAPRPPAPIPNAN